MAELSGRQVDKLGERLRDSERPEPADLDLLAAVVADYDSALNEVAGRLRSIGLEPTARLKTSGTIIDKLKRPPFLRLRSIHDLAGARVVRRMTLDDQDELVASIVSIWPGAEVIDRRDRPSHGYRAVHVIPRVQAKPVEIQVRTFFQDTWAQAMELQGDRWGREIRYGGGPSDPDAPIGDIDSTTRAQFVDEWKQLADVLHHQAEVENLLVRARSGRVELTAEEIHDLEERERQFMDVTRVLREIRRRLGLHTDVEQ
ncbi:MAG: RelA/SpoT domain-containing protein [Acidimicrobiales bacterium]